MVAKRDVSDEVELRNSKSNPFGWSQHEVWHNDKRIGWIESGAPDITDPDYTAEITREGAQDRLTIYMVGQVLA